MTSIKPFFHLKNYKVGIYDAILKKGVDATPRSPEYREGYDFGIYLYKEQQKGAILMLDLEKIIMSMQAEIKCIKARLLVQEQRAIHQAEIDATREENKND